MARNSRFRTTSGPSSNRPRRDEKKPFKPYGERKEDKPDRKRSFGKRIGKSKPFEKKEFEKKSFEKKRWSKDSTGEKRSDFARKRISNYHTSDKNPRDAGESSGERKRFGSEGGRGGRPEGKSGGFVKRGARPFSKDDFKRRKEGTGESSPSSISRGDQQGFEKRRSFRGPKQEHGRKRVSDPAAENPEQPKDDLIRLNKFISNSGVCSRREADDLITMGVITVNGKPVTELGFKVKATDDVRYEGRRLKSEKPIYILLNKPKGYITTTDDPQERNTVMQLIQGACKERVYPVGRLDRNTSGLLLLTNDGDLTDKLTHPSYNVKKIYKAELDKPLTKEDFQKIKDGVRLEEGKAIVDDLAIVSDDGLTVGVEIHIGWNRVIRRIFEALGYEVIKLDRSVYATLDKKDLSRGHWRFLRQDEVIRLKHFQ